MYLGSMITAFLIFLKKKKLRKYAALVLAGSMLAFIMRITEQAGMEKRTVTEIMRDETAGNDKKVEMQVKIQKKEEEQEEAETKGEKIVLEIEKQKYTKEELEVLEEEMWEHLEKEILGQNTSFDYVTEALSFPEQVKGYPFVLIWSSDNRELLSQEGGLGENVSKEGELARVNVRIIEKKSGFEKERQFYVKIYPSQTSEAYLKRLQDHIQRSQALTTEKDRYVLPESFEGKELVFEEKKEDKSRNIFLLSLIGAVLLGIGAEEEEKKRKQKRREEIEKEYPAFAVRMAMLSDTGLTISGAFRRIAAEYGKQRQKREQPLYEELMITCREMESGVSEKSAYQNLANRCSLPCIVRFSSILVQYMQSGAGGLKRALREEAEKALAEKRERVRKKGEEAGTKLLLPMMLLLVLVMVILMIPAFAAFRL